MSSAKDRADVVDRLRPWSHMTDGGQIPSTMHEAAAEIEALRGVVREYESDPNYARSRDRLKMGPTSSYLNSTRIDGLQKTIEALRTHVRTLADELERIEDTDLVKCAGMGRCDAVSPCGGCTARIIARRAWEPVRAARRAIGEGTRA